MKNLIWVIALLMLIFIGKITAQDNPEKPTVKISGYVRTEAFYDTYRSYETRDGEIYYYPLRKGLDKDGVDTCKLSQFEMLGLQSRIRATASGTSVLGAKLSGFIEADFQGTSSDYKFMFRLRHAIIKLDWAKTQLLMGQYWHPTILPELASNTVLGATGPAFHPLNRPAQLRVTREIIPNFKIAFTISAFAAHRPIEPSYNNSGRNSGLPQFHLQAQIGDVSKFFAAVTGGYKFLKPYLTTKGGVDSVFNATKIVGSYVVHGIVGASLPAFSIKLSCVYGENLTDLSFMGGYAPVANSRNIKGEYDYANMTTMTLWTDIETKGTKVKFGLFAGYAENLGTKKDVIINKQIKKELCKDADLKEIFRIEPRVTFIFGSFDLGIEYIMTGANYGTFTNKEIIDVKDKSVNNRFLVAAKYSF